jgi:hypothetical protein
MLTSYIVSGLLLSRHQGRASPVFAKAFSVPEIEIYISRDFNYFHFSAGRNRLLDDYTGRGKQSYWPVTFLNFGVPRRRCVVGPGGGRGRASMSEKKSW